MEAVVGESEVLVVGSNDPRSIAELKRHARADQVVLDLVNIGDRAGLRSRYVGLSW
jgi:hypothetical protein